MDARASNHVTFPAEFWPDKIHFVVGYSQVWYILKQLFATEKVNLNLIQLFTFYPHC